jgi:hypothetical protein
MPGCWFQQNSIDWIELNSVVEMSVVGPDALTE